jgi:hypothetical protein
MKAHVRNYIAVNNKLFSLLNILEFLLCKSCYRRENPHEDIVLTSYHHHGRFFDILFDCPKIEIDKLKLWENDTLHGLFHGFCTLFMASYYMEKLTSISAINAIDRHGQTPSQIEKMIASCLFHDFYKVIKEIGDDDETHAKKLKEWFPKLLPQTFNHTNPNEQQEKHPLIVGDRLEHHRYPEHQEWIDYSKLDKYLTAQEWTEVQIFYRIIRPGLERLFLNRRNCWIRHGIEEESYKFQEPHYPDKKYFQEVSQKQTKSWPIEVDLEPFGECIRLHTGSLWMRYYGLIELQRCKDLGITVEHAAGKDHLSMNGKIKKEEWVFCHELKPRSQDFMDAAITANVIVLPQKVGIKMLRVF